MSRLAILHLSDADPRFAALIRRVGRPKLPVYRGRELYEALIRAIAHQQLHGKAAEAILGRFMTLYTGDGFPPPERVLNTKDIDLRGCGFSAAKLASIQDICAKTLDGTVPTRRQATRLSDEALIERLITIRGVGRWTVEMLLIFTLGRPDVLPVDDFGVREGYRVAYGRRARPTPKALRALGERWKPYRSVAAWYLWRAASEAKKKAKP